MSDLNTGGGGFPANWAMGGIWMGYHPATDDDITAYRLGVNNPAAGIDEGTLVGRYDRGYKVAGKPSSSGGEGSTTYEYQNVAEGVIFAPMDPKWWVYGDTDSPRKNKPREALHYVYPDPNDKSYSDLYVGAESGTLAGVVQTLGGDFAWFADQARYRMVDRNGDFIDYVRIKSD